MQFYIQHYKTVFFITLRGHIDITYKKRVAWMKNMMYLNSLLQDLQ